MAKLFKKQSAIDTLVNVGIGGAANVAMNYAFSLIPAGTFGNNEELVKNAIKIGVGVLGGTMVSGSAAKYIRPAVDGIATVGASELISGLITEETKPSNGVPFIGRVRVGQRGFRRVSGTGNVGTVPFMA